MLQDAFKDSPQATLGLKLLKIGDIGVVGKDFSVGDVSATSGKRHAGGARNKTTGCCIVIVSGGSYIAYNS